MPAPFGTIVDLNVIQKRIGRLKKLIVENNMTAAHTLSTDILADLTTLNTAIQAASFKQNLSADSTLDLLENP